MRLIRLFFLILFIQSGFLCADDSSHDAEVLPAGQIFQGDYYALGDLVEISGVVKGNAYLMGTRVLIDGTVEGKVFILAGDLEISGKVLGDVWALAGGAAISGDLGKDIVLLSANAQFNPSNKVAGNVTVLAGNAEIENKIAGNATALAANLKIAGSVGHNVRSFVGKLRIAPSAYIQGDLKYRSNDPASIDPSAQIKGSVLYQRLLLHDLVDIPVIKGIVIGSKVAAFLMNFIYTFVVGVIMIRLFPRKLHKALNSLQETPLRSLWYGLVLLVLFPLASLILLATVIGAPFALTLIALNIVTFYTAKVFTILWIANELFSKWHWKRNGLMTLFSGQVLYCILVAIPFIGPFLAFLTMVLGLGAIAAAQRE